MTQTQSVSETTLRITRKLAAPRELVFKTWTEPESLANWWRAQSDMTTPIAEVDLRVGGKYRLAMKAPDNDQPFIVGGVYKEITPPEKLVYTWAWEHELPEDQYKSGTGQLNGLGNAESLVTVEFHDVCGQTEVVVTHEFFVDSAARDNHAHGWGGCLEQLAVLVEGANQ